MANIRICSRCGKIGLDQYDFYLVWQPPGKYYYRLRCKSCELKRYNEWRLNNLEHKQLYDKQYGKEYYKQYRIEHPVTPEQRRITSLKHRFGITIEQYDIILKSQNNKCAICKRHVSEFPRRLAVDHNHETSEIRGLLCGRCNMGLGYFNDNKELLNRALKYLKKFGE